VKGYSASALSAEPTVFGHNGAIIGARSVVMRRRFVDPVDPAVTHAAVVAVSFNGGSFDDTLVGFGTNLGPFPPAQLGVADEIFTRELAYGAQHGWPKWNLFDEVDLPTYGL
jgi:hypothetical protein